MSTTHRAVIDRNRVENMTHRVVRDRNRVKNMTHRAVIETGIE